MPRSRLQNKTEKRFCGLPSLSGQSHVEDNPLFAAMNRCAVQNRALRRVFQQPLAISSFPDRTWIQRFDQLSCPKQQSPIIAIW